MTIRYLNSTLVLTAPATDAINALTGEFIIVGAQGVYGSTTADGLDSALVSSDINVTVLGLVFGALEGIDLFDTTGTNSVTVGAGGRILSETLEAVLINGTNATVVNQGLIQSYGAAGISSGATGTTTITNTGTILANSLANGVWVTGTGNATVVNTGTIMGELSVRTGDGNDVVWNTGSLLGGVQMGAGNDLYQGTGRVEGTINGGLGNDTVIGTAFDDQITDSNGANWLAGGDGSDVIMIGSVAGDGVDVVFGGEIGGGDSSTSDTLQVNFNGGAGVNIFLTGNYVTTLTNQLLAVTNGIENATGTFVNDGIFGSNGANVLDGGNGNDWIVGNGGADTFRFAAASQADGDNIRDFRRSEGDRIDLGLIDADPATVNDDSFVFRTTRTTGAVQEAVVTNFGTSAVVDLYIDSDTIIDGTFVVVYGEAGVTSLTALDFLL